MIHHSKHFKLIFFIIVVLAAALLSFLVFAVKGSLYFTSRYVQMTTDYVRYRTVQAFSADNAAQFASLLPPLSQETADLPESSAVSVPVLMYHGIDNVGEGVNVTIDDFREHMQVLHGAGYSTLSLQEFAEFLRGERQVSERSFVLTFDDSRRDSYYEVDPLLRLYGFRAVMAVATGKTLEEPTQFYLSRQEIREMTDTGRWEVMSYGHNIHEEAVISENGARGPSISNVVYSAELARVETKTEYAARIRKDLELSKRTLETLIGKSVIAFALPTGRFGLKEEGFSDAESIAVATANGIYPLVFSDIFPREPGAFRSNAVSLTPVARAKRIIVPSGLSGAQMAELLSAEKAVNLPYEESFDNPFRFIPAFGSAEIQEGALVLSSEKSSALTYLDGTYGLSDVYFSVEFQSAVTDGSVSLVSRYADTNNYAQCEFGPTSVVAKIGGGEKVRRIDAVSLPKEYRINAGTSVQLGVVGEELRCFVNNKQVLQTRLIDAPKRGGVGIKYWNASGKEGEVRISGLSIVLPQDSPEAVNSSRAQFTPVLEGGRGILYSHFDRGSIATADAMLSGVFTIDRYKPVRLEQITWKEDPYNEPYWRFNFYNLDSTRHLLFAWRKTGNKAYHDKLVEIVSSFIRNGMNSSPYAWDLHGAAFRAMVLTNTYDKLLRGGGLTPGFRSELLHAIQKHGEFLLAEVHYERDYNHGLDQSAALYLLAQNFPELPGAGHWKTIALSRLNENITGIIDSDGVLVENSPYYHFYVLEKYFEIAKYLGAEGNPLAGRYNSTIKKMIDYGSLILQPDLHVPTLGASLDRSFQSADVYAEMASTNAAFSYVLTEGRSGTRPQKKNVYLPAAGQTIMRSSFASGAAFKKAVQVIFDVGNYRTDHSDLDALSFHLYGNGGVLMPDAGLYTYESGPYRDYFHGTRGHNTVVVDGMDQTAGELQQNADSKVTAGELVEGDSYAYQSAEHRLYPGVTHRRALALFSDSLLIVVDDLSSEKSHAYEQRFHTAPGSKVSGDARSVTAAVPFSAQKMRVEQLSGTSNIEFKTINNERGEVIDGLCSLRYEEAKACPVLSYTKTGIAATFVTAIHLGAADNSRVISYDEGSRVLKLSVSGRQYEVNINRISRTPRKAVAEKPKTAESFFTQGVYAPVFEVPASWAKNSDRAGVVSEMTASDPKGKPVLRFTPSTSGEVFRASKKAALDLSHQNPVFWMRVTNRAAVIRLAVVYSNNNWSRSVSYDLRADLYPPQYEGEWVRVGIGKGEFRNPMLGNWDFVGGTFDWSSVDGVRIVAQVTEGASASVDVSDFSLYAEPTEARAVIIFDDGWSTVMGAADVMKRYEMRGNVGVISSAVGTRNYMTLEELRHLQNDHGWGIANHSSLHKNALEVYDAGGQYAAYEEDVVDGLDFLIRNKINSAPNWFIYPHGKTNGRLKEIISKYYTFARATQDIPETFPFADPLAVKVLSVYSGQATVQDVKSAIADAKKYKLQLFLMFHKFAEDEAPKMFTEYGIADFEAIIKEIHDQGIKVVTFSEFDKDFGVPETRFTITPEVPAKLELTVREVR